MELKSAIGVKINLDWLYDSEKTTDWELILDKLYQPFVCYLDSISKKKLRVTVHQYSVGIHTNGKTAIPHIHFNFHCDYCPNNILANYKYYYSTHFGDKNHFKTFKHSIKHMQMTELKGWLAYPFKECVDESNHWKALTQSNVAPYTLRELITHGAGTYLASCNSRAKTELKEEKKLEKWGQFCKHMDSLRNTPTVNEMGDLRGVCLLALDYFRQQPERSSVNAVITMCKDYAFKRGIWTNQEILDKYQIS